MTPEKFAYHIIFSGKLEDKLSSFEVGDFRSYGGSVAPEYPERDPKICFSPKKIKFPRTDHFHLKEKRGMALHYFANHELLAIEMMATFLWKFPTISDDDRKIKQGILMALRDEQRHLRLYLTRMEELGVEFGDFPLNDFFWKQMKNIKSQEQFLAVMALTFESANLDFSLFYKKVFFDVEDFKSSDLMEIIFKDELAHVRLGFHWLNKWKMDKELFDYYQSILPENITPMRARGIGYQRENREVIGFDHVFFDKLEKYNDEKPFLNRKRHV